MSLKDSHQDLMKLFFTIILSFFFCSYSTPMVACSLGSISERLENYCLINKINSSTITLATAQQFDIRMRNEGYDSNLSLNAGSTKGFRKTAVSPILSWENDLNGGNPAKDLVLGEVNFSSDQDLYKKSGLVAGVRAGLQGRRIYGAGLYFDYSLNGSHSRSGVHDIAITQTGISLCSKNHITKWYFIDGCADISRTNKEITDQKTKNIRLTTSHIFSSQNSNYHKASFGLNRNFTSTYTQHQLTFGLDTIHSNFQTSSFYLTFGEAVQGELANRFSVAGNANLLHENKNILFNWRFSQADGGKLLGFDRSEKSLSLSITYPLSRFVTATVGYRKTDSTIDYFDTGYPTFSLQFQSFEF